jgi:hypothetical protein
VEAVLALGQEPFRLAIGQVGFLWITGSLRHSPKLLWIDQEKLGSFLYWSAWSSYLGITHIWLNSDEWSKKRTYQASQIWGACWLAMDHAKIDLWRHHWGKSWQKPKTGFEHAYQHATWDQSKACWDAKSWSLELQMEKHS